MSALCFKKKRPRSSSNRLFSKSITPISRLKFSGRTGLLDSNSYDEWRSGKFEQFDKPSHISEFNENDLSKTFNSIILIDFSSLDLFKTECFFA